MQAADLGRRGRSIAAISVLLVLASRASAQPAAAEALFDDGTKLLAAGKYAEACNAFEASNNMDPRAGTLIYLGQCREALHQVASAWTAYKDALARAKDPVKRDLATAKVAELEPKLSFLTIKVGDAKVDGLAITRNGKTIDPLVWDRALPVDGGDYTIAASAPDHKPWQQAISVPAEQGHVEVAVPKLVEIPKPKPITVTKDEPPPGPWTFNRQIAVGLGGVAIAAGVTGVVLGLQANSKKSDAFALCPDVNVACDRYAEANSLISTAHSRALAANVMYGISAAAAIGGAVLWLTGAPEKHGVAIVPTMHGAAVAGSF